MDCVEGLGVTAVMRPSMRVERCRSWTESAESRPWWWWGRAHRKGRNAQNGMMTPGDLRAAAQSAMKRNLPARNTLKQGPKAAGFVLALDTCFCCSSLPSRLPGWSPKDSLATSLSQESKHQRSTYAIFARHIAIACFT
ncbi:hypothetical protein CC78DRAFT_592155 [Lojkania enalia]|uniref:Uncharacterized protein n=1 Tax=Lojkania enalia TaxID=147567 RepID=A0A9P4N5I5_9PLEO|nr:hypothetical protein CC78DRAFT_592155 [Didymosphaeria enalia]